MLLNFFYYSCSTLATFVMGVVAKQGHLICIAWVKNTYLAIYIYSYAPMWAKNLAYMKEVKVKMSILMTRLYLFSVVWNTVHAWVWLLSILPSPQLMAECQLNKSLLWLWWKLCFLEDICYNHCVYRIIGFYLYLIPFQVNLACHLDWFIRYWV